MVPDIPTEKNRCSIREKILEGTITEFNEKGLKFTMDELAGRLSISKKTLYKHFADKRALFFAMVDYSFSAIKASERRILEDPQMDVVEKIRRIVVVLPEKYAEIDFRRLWGLKNDYPDVFEKVAERLTNDWEPTVALLEKGISEGRIRQISIPVFKVMVESSIENFLSGRTLLDSHIPYRKALDEMMTILMKGIEVQGNVNMKIERRRDPSASK